MQNIIFYASAANTLAEVRTAANDGRMEAPTLVKGVECVLKMRLFACEDEPIPYPIGEFGGIVSWSWTMDSDFSAGTAPKLVADNARITVASVTGGSGDFTEFTIPMPDMDTVELNAWLATSEEKNALHGELVGYDGTGREVFVLQVKNFTVRGRITSTGEPTPVEDSYLNAAQVRALIASGLAVEFSEDTVAWHASQTERDLFYRLRSASSESGEWSDPIAMAKGVKGDKGEGTFLYLAYAADASGTQLSFTPSAALKYMARIESPTAIEPTAEDFADAVWLKYLGDDGKGVGDMEKSVYDADGDGKVDAAKIADSASAVDWGNVAGKPEVFPIGKHTHQAGDIANPVSQRFSEPGNIAYLLTDTPVLRNAGWNSSGAIELAFDGIRTSEGGEPYVPEATEMLTWEYHVRCSADVTEIVFGNGRCTMEGVNLPTPLKLIEGDYTWHVFVIRAIRREDAINGIYFCASYAYSYRA